MKRAHLGFILLINMGLAQVGAAQSLETTLEQSPIIGRMNMERDRVFVGETFAIELSLYSDGPELAGAPSISALPDDAPLKLADFRSLTVQRDAVWRGKRQIMRYRGNATAATNGSFSLSLPLRGSMLLRRNGIFSSIRVRPHRIPMPALTIRIDPVPTHNAPASFDGPVGQRFTFDVSISTNVVTPGDLIKVTTRIAGEHALPAGIAPHISMSDGFRTYPSRETRSESGRSVSFEQIVIPLNMEATRLGPAHFSYFNPLEARFITETRGPFPLSLSETRPELRATRPTSLSAPNANAGLAEMGALATHWLTLSVSDLPASAQSSAETARAAFEAGAYGRATELLKQLIDLNPEHAGPLFHNLGTAAVLDGALGEAILAYARALRTASPPSETPENLRIVAAITGVSGDGLGQKALRSRASLTTWRVLSAVFLIATLALVVQRHRSRSVPAKRLLALALCGTLAGLAMCTHAWARSQSEDRVPVAIMLHTRAAQFGPVQQARDLFTIREGATVRVLTRHRNWAKVEHDGNIGWVPDGHLEAIERHGSVATPGTAAP